MSIQQRPIRDTGVSVSEIGFGVWTIATGWWGSYTRDEATALIRDAFDLGVTFFNTSNAYGEDGYGETLVRDALADVRDQVTIATTFGYDLESERPEGYSGQAERAHEWTKDNLQRSLERSLTALDTDSIDLWQLHNPRMDAMHDDQLWELLYDLRKQGVVKSFGPSIGPAIGWKDEGLFALENRDIDFFHHIYNMLEQEPGRSFTEAAAERDVAMLVRVPHSSGLLEGRFTPETRFDVTDHRSHRREAWLHDGLKKLDALTFLTHDREGATLGQVSIKWLLADPQTASVQPNINTAEQLREFVAAVDIEDLDADELGEIETLYGLDFGVVPSAEPGERLIKA
ncbi:MAG: aldo/keto reductase [Thermoleophilia bacterium]|nr:aldo/keto reductase [Thermoleophilia bacterium]